MIMIAVIAKPIRKEFWRIAINEFFFINLVERSFVADCILFEYK